MANAKDLKQLISILPPIIEYCNSSQLHEALLLATLLGTARLYLQSLFVNDVKEEDNTTLLRVLASHVTNTLVALEDLVSASSFRMVEYTEIQYRKLFSLSRRDPLEPYQSVLIPFGDEENEQKIALAKKALKTLNCHLAKIAVKADPEIPPPEAGDEVTKLLVDPFLVRQKANVVFSAIRSFFEECKASGCKFLHSGLLFMRLCPQEQGPVFDLLFSLEDGGEPPWGECRITAPDSQRQDSILLPLKQGETRCSRLRGRCLYANSAKALKNDPDDNESFHEIRLADPQRTSLHRATIVSFRDILQASNAPSWPMETGIMLALYITYTTFALTDTSWLPACLSNEEIRFLQDLDKLYLEPCIYSKFSLPNEFGDLKDDLGEHDDPCRLVLGIVLIELWRQSTLTSEHVQRDLQDGTIPSKNTTYDRAVRVTLETDFSNHQYYEDAVRSCIQPRGTLRPSYNDENYQEFLREKIFSRLVYEARMFPKFDLKNLENILQHRTMPKVAVAPRPPKLFEKIPSSLDDSHARMLLAKLQEISSRISENFREKTTPKRRVQIAILDTGVDVWNTLLRREEIGVDDKTMTEVMKFRDCLHFPNNSTQPDASKKESCMDFNGHGTHIAGIYRWIAQIADIHVIKIADANNIPDIRAAIEVVSRGIEFAHKTWKVDIINMSFGFPYDSPELEPARTALKNAVSDGIIVFASSNNDGDSRSVPWPAIDQELVIRINSADSNAHRSHYSSFPRPGQTNISALGENIPSPDANSALRTKHATIKTLTGTSFATPLAACMASLALYLMDNVDLTKDQAERAVFLRTTRGMRNVLSKYFVDTREVTTDGFYYISPDFFFRQDRQMGSLVTLIDALMIEEEERSRHRN